MRVDGESLVEERFNEGEVDPSPRGMGRPFLVLLKNHSNLDGGWEGGGGQGGGEQGGGRQGGGADGGGGGDDRDRGEDEEQREKIEREEQGEDDWVN